LVEKGNFNTTVNLKFKGQTEKAKVVDRKRDIEEISMNTTEFN